MHQFDRTFHVVCCSQRTTTRFIYKMRLLSYLPTYNKLRHHQHRNLENIRNPFHICQLKITIVVMERQHNNYSNITQLLNNRSLTE